jgi:predicted amidohydrolase
MKSIAKGQAAQANVLGKDKAFELAYIKEVLAAAAANPQIVKFPTTFVMGGENGGGLTGAAAILGASNVSLGMKNQQNQK